MERKSVWGFLYSPNFLSLIPWFDGVTGLGVYSAGVKTGLADCAGSTPYSIPPRGLLLPLSHATHFTSRWALALDSYPSMLYSSRVPQSQAGYTVGPSPSCFGEGRSRAVLEVLPWDAQQEWKWSYVVWIDHW